MQDQQDTDLVRLAFRRTLQNAAALAASVGLLQFSLLLYFNARDPWPFVVLAIGCVPLYWMLGEQRSFAVFFGGNLILMALTLHASVSAAREFGAHAAYHYYVLVAMLLLVVAGRIRMRTKVVLLVLLGLYFIALDWSLVMSRVGLPDEARLTQILRAVNLSIVAFGSTALMIRYFAIVSHQQRQLVERAGTDQLTGLLNRHGLLEAVAAEVALARRHQQPLTVALCDLDHFKRVNDSYGHAAGDAALRHTAQVLGGTLRASDRVARWGGEEFLVVMPQSSLADGTRLCERVLESLRSVPLLCDGRTVQLTATFGIAELDESEGFERAVSRADAALYAGKSQGRDRVVAA